MAAFDKVNYDFLTYCLTDMEIRRPTLQQLVSFLHGWGHKGSAWEEDFAMLPPGMHNPPGT